MRTDVPALEELQCISDIVRKLISKAGYTAVMSGGGAAERVVALPSSTTQSLITQWRQQSRSCDPAAWVFPSEGNKN